MQYFFCKLIPPRATFMQDITPAESSLMRQHGQYWRERMAEGKVVAFGPVADPKGGFGIAVIRLEDGAGITALTDNDPVIRAQAGFSFEVNIMPQAVHPEF